MKTVFDSSQCAHIWAQRSQPHGRNATNSVHFDGGTFYSYATPIANFAPLNKREPRRYAALISSRSYSATTNSKHLPVVRSAVHGVHVFYVPDVGVSAGRAPSEISGPMSDPASWKKVHKTNLAYLVGEYAALKAKLLRLQSWGWTDPGDAAASLMRALQPVRRYAELFKLREPKLPIDADSSEIWARCERLTLERASPKYAAKQAASAARREVADAKKAAKRARENELALAASAVRIAAWRAGEIDSLRYHDTDGRVGAMLRVKGAEVQTSQGARVSVTDAKELLRQVQRVRRLGFAHTVTPTPDALKIGAFPVKRIETNGDITVGCHFIRWEEIERIAPQLV